MFPSFQPVLAGICGSGSDSDCDYKDFGETGGSAVHGIRCCEFKFVWFSIFMTMSPRQHNLKIKVYEGKIIQTCTWHGHEFGLWFMDFGLILWNGGWDDSVFLAPNRSSRRGSVRVCVCVSVCVWLLGILHSILTRSSCYLQGLSLGLS